MGKDDFWDTCVLFGVVVVPFMAYPSYNAEGNIDYTTKIGIRFVCLQCDDMEAVLEPGDFYFALDTLTTNLELVADTPELALENYMRLKINK